MSTDMVPDSYWTWLRGAEKAEKEAEMKTSRFNTCLDATCDLPSVSDQMFCEKHYADALKWAKRAREIDADKELAKRIQDWEEFFDGG